jgi:hypothetical protein
MTLNIPKSVFRERQPVAKSTRVKDKIESRAADRFGLGGLNIASGLEDE